MNKLINYSLGLLAMTLVAACGVTTASLPIPSAPVVVADTTTLDEKGAIGVELAYKAARIAVETGIEAGYIKGQRASTIAELDNRAYGAVLAVRAAYRTGNATSYANAFANANLAITALGIAANGSK